MKKIGLGSKASRILYTMSLLVKGSEDKIKFEDIVVKSFELFPDVFQLDGHNNFPDSHKVNRSIYTDLKPNGFVKTYGNGYYKLTSVGYNVAKLFQKNKSELNLEKDEEFEKEKTKILHRLLNTQAYKLFINSNKDLIVDSDFFNFYRVSIRMKKSEFINNIKIINIILDEARNKNIKEIEILYELNNYLQKKYSNIISNIGGSDGNKNLP